jgi:hypothetical protein
VSGRVPIPPELAAEVREAIRLGLDDRWQPMPGDGAKALLLASAGPWPMPGQEIRLSYRNGALAAIQTHHQDGTLNESAGVLTDRFWQRTAWALIGDVDGGARPEPGQRVIVLAWAGGSTEPEVYVVTSPSPTRDDVPSGSIEVRAPGGDAVGGGVFGAHYHATRWALLPDAGLGECDICHAAPATQRADVHVGAISGVLPACEPCGARYAAEPPSDIYRELVAALDQAISNVSTDEASRRAAREALEFDQ